MSHFTVAVRIPAEIPATDDIETAVGRLLDPYCEHTDNGRLTQYMIFVNTEAEQREKYEKESTEWIRLAGGELESEYDERFRKRGSLFEGDKYEYPADSVKVSIPHAERYSTFEEYMKDYCGEERDVDGRYGYLSNPNAKWDWWTIGGRWRGHLLVKPSEDAGLGEVSWVFKEGRNGPAPGGPDAVDFCRIEKLDWERIAATARERVQKFWSEVDLFFSGKEWEMFDGPRENMLALGILDCKDAPELTGGEYWKQKWPRQNKPGVDRFDVVAEKPSPEKLDALALAHFNPIGTWAYLDASGWHGKGRMGWWAANDATPESRAEYADRFTAWLKSGDQRDWIVVVDCHI